jgi:Protein of unknown function (DUF2829)
MDFGQALEELKAGNRVERAGWNGRSLWVGFRAENVGDGPTNDGKARRLALGASVVLRPYLAMRSADGELAYWTASQADVMAEDWSTVTSQG